MNDQFPLDLFAAAQEGPARRGYRLDRLEVKNFGGYHGRATVFDFGLKGAVFSGDNGAGKSTAIDAYRLLFRSRPRFNSATTQQTNDRSVETYYIGQYGKKDGHGAERVLALRGYGNENGFLAVCGVFRTDHGEVFSALRMCYYPKKGEPPQWRLITAKADLSIERDFPQWMAKGPCSRLAQAFPGGVFHPTFEEFFAATGAAFGIDRPEDAKAAFRFVDQSIGVKKLDSITEFARANIFPRASLEGSAETAIDVFEQVRQAIRTIERCEAKIARLDEVVRKFGFYERAVQSHEEIVTRKARFEQWSFGLQRANCGRILRRTERRAAGLLADLDRAAAIEAEARATREALGRVMSEKGIGNLPELIRDRLRLVTQLEAITTTGAKLVEAFKAFRLAFAFGTEAELAASRERLASFIETCRTRIRELSEERQALKDALAPAQVARRQAGDRLTSMLESKTAIDPKLLAAREALAQHLGLGPSDIPFLAELVQVRQDALEWEGTANRVLGSLGCEILVEAGYAAAARRFLNSRHWGARIVVNEVKELAPAAVQGLDGRALARRIEVLETHRFRDVARHLVDLHAGHVCLSEAEFAQAKGSAVTREGSVLRNGRLVKDDRRRIDDRSSYVLGWDITDRVELAKRELDGAKAAVEDLEAKLSEYNGGIAAWEGRREAALRLEGSIPSFAGLDPEPLSREVVRLTAEIEAMNSPEAQDLRDRLRQAEAREKEARVTQDRIRGDLGSAKSTIDSARSERDRKGEQLRASLKSLGPATYADRLAYRKVALEVIGPTRPRSPSLHLLAWSQTSLTDTLADMSRRFGAANNSELNIARTGNDAKTAARDLLMEFPEEGGLLEGEVVGDLKEPATLTRARAVREEWRGRLHKLRADDLPRHRKSFQDRQKASAMDAVNAIQTDTNSYAERLKAMENGLNRILETLVYDPMEGTRARLRIRPRSDDLSIQKFRAALADARAHSYAEAKVVEEKTQAVVDMINDTISKAGAAQRETILDLTNWHEMDVEEYYVNEDGRYRDQRRFYAGRDGASGGQGERLTMLLIGAAMAYTFGAHDETRQAHGLQTIVLDEAFMHGSEEMASAATEVLDAMGLQVIAATPVQKLQAFAGKTERVFDISKRDEQIRHVASTYAELEAEQVTEERRIEAELDAERMREKAKGHAA